MRRRLQEFLPIVLIALMVQILAPISACWAAAIAASDPLQGVEICHTDSAPGESGQSGSHRAHDGACAICCLTQANASFDTPLAISFVVPYRDVACVVWRDGATDRAQTRFGSHAQARAPPFPA
jgi:Protein of unknown function (DUF2946)